MRKTCVIIFAALALLSFSNAFALASWQKEIPKNKAYCAIYKIKGCTIMVGANQDLLISSTSKDGKVEEVIEIKKIPMAGCAGYHSTKIYYELPPRMFNGMAFFRALQTPENTNIFTDCYGSAARNLPPAVKKLFRGFYGIG